jgi:hypothetical protein
VKVRLSPGVRVLLHPQSTYAALAGQAIPISVWRALRRPAFVAFVLGCTISLITFPGLTLRLAGPSVIYWTFIPLAEILALGLTCGRKSGSLSFPEKVDLFFAGHLPWLLWLIGLSAAFSFFSPGEAFAFTQPFWLLCAAPAVIVWSAWIDFGFYRSILRSSRGGAVARLVAQRAISWSVILLIFSGSVVWQSPHL